MVARRVRRVTRIRKRRVFKRGRVGRRRVFRRSVYRRRKGRRVIPTKWVTHQEFEWNANAFGKWVGFGLKQVPFPGPAQELFQFCRLDGISIRFRKIQPPANVYDYTTDDPPQVKATRFEDIDLYYAPGDRVPQLAPEAMKRAHLVPYGFYTKWYYNKATCYRSVHYNGEAGNEGANDGLMVRTPSKMPWVSVITIGGLMKNGHDVDPAGIYVQDTDANLPAGARYHTLFPRRAGYFFQETAASTGNVSVHAQVKFYWSFKGRKSLGPQIRNASEMPSTDNAGMLVYGTETSIGGTTSSLADCMRGADSDYCISRGYVSKKRDENNEST